MLKQFRATQAAKKAANVITSFRSQQPPEKVSSFVRGGLFRKAMRKEDGRNAGMEARPLDLVRPNPTQPPALPIKLGHLPSSPKPAPSSPKPLRPPKHY